MISDTIDNVFYFKFSFVDLLNTIDEQDINYFHRKLMYIAQLVFVDTLINALIN